MAHEFRYLQEQPREVLTYILTAGGFIALVMVLVALYLRWKHPRALKARRLKSAMPRVRRKRSRKR